MNKNDYSFHHVFPIPIQNLTIIPPKPYLVLGTNSHLWKETECLHIEEIFICKGLPQPNEDTCIPEILQGNKGTNCDYTPIHHVEPIVEQIDPTHILVITTHQPVTCQTKCKDAKIRKITRPTEITFTTDCSVKINDVSYRLEPELKNGSSLLLPELFDVPQSKPHHTLRLHSIKLDELSELHGKFQSLQPIGISDLPKDDASHLWIYVLIGVVICLTFIMLSCWIKRKRFIPKINIFFRAQKTSQDDHDVQMDNVGSNPTKQRSTPSPTGSPF